MRHDLKTVQPHFDALWDGRKTFEYRKDDRHYQVGDVLVLREWSESGGYSGKEIEATVTYLIHVPPPDDGHDYVILALKFKS